jgi:hypothetical protein
MLGDSKSITCSDATENSLCSFTVGPVTGFTDRFALATSRRYLAQCGLFHRLMDDLIAARCPHVNPVSEKLLVDIDTIALDSWSVEPLLPSFVWLCFKLKVRSRIDNLLLLGRCCIACWWLFRLSGRIPLPIYYSWQE